MKQAPVLCLGGKVAEIKTLQCVVCNTHYSPSEVEYTCPQCGEIGTLDILYDYAHLNEILDRDSISGSKNYSSWRYKPLLPIHPDTSVPPLRVGWTPLYESSRLVNALDAQTVWVKDDGLNPTGSLKDRASTHVVARAIEKGIKVISTASTGNAAAALAGVCASVADAQAVIFVPASAPPAKIAQLLVYGATVLLVEGTYDQAFDLCTQACVEHGWYSRNTGVNPYTTEGKKTVSLEISEQLDWHVPDVVCVSVGDGSIISGVYKGFWDLLQLGWIERIPRLIGVQATGSAALFHAWQQGVDAREMVAIDAHTVADSISAGLPRDRAKALRAVRQTKGVFVAVEDDQIVSAIPELAQQSGVFAEPAAAATWAGAKAAREQGHIQSQDRVLLLVTGNGLKDIQRARESVGEAIHVQPDQESVNVALKQLGIT